MSRFDDELRRAFSREEPSPDFTDRVMARIAEARKLEKPREKPDWLKRLMGFFQPAPVKWAMAGAMAVLLIIAGFGVHTRRENERRRLAEIAEGERAKEQVMLAFRIASAKLNVARKKIHEATDRESESK
ncbi:MAG TPA: anti-sigma factor [Blastocatellia bacterium]|nr:anti-sigma factor [Blastocatellia bacterium]